MEIRHVRIQVLATVVASTIAFGVLGFFWAWCWWGLALTVPLLALGAYDYKQKTHSLLRNYPIVGRLRYLIEEMGPEMRQYVVESNTEGRPFNRDLRSLMYQRAKDVVDKKPFGTEQLVYAETYRWLTHSMSPAPTAEDPARTFRLTVGPDCDQPYSASVLNISAMSFGSLSGAAILALNRGAKKGGFAHDTGEGGLSKYHLEPGGDVIWQIGTAYFGCRTSAGGFDADVFREKARLDAVKMIEIKISQGAKPGHGGVLPARKVSREIAEARGIPVGKECVSPAFHTAFSSPTGLCEYVAQLRDLSGGKPVGFKLCVGRIDEFYAVCKAMIETGITPDFITVDGGEGGTGAAPVEFCDHIGMPLREGIVVVRNALVGAGLRDKVKIAASGKRVTAFEIAAAFALGADWCNSARGFMFALGCIQAQACHTNECPVGVTTQDPALTRGLVVADKGERVYHFHRNTVEALAEVVAAAGLESPWELTPAHLYQRTSPTHIETFEQLYDFVEERQLVEGTAAAPLQQIWNRANTASW